MLPEKSYRAILREELEARCHRNSRYSLRAFARDLGINPSRLSEVLGGRYGLSGKAALMIAEKLGCNEAETAHFCDLVEAEHGRARRKKVEARARLQLRSSENYQQLTLDSFRVISDWYHYAILELTLVHDFQSSPQWIAKCLGISEHVAISAIERLKRLELLVEKNGCLKAGNGFTASPSGIPSDALKKSHQQFLEKALSSLYLQTLDERDFSHMVLAINKDQIKEAKEDLKKFRRSFDSKFGRASRKDTVYCLGLTFFRIQEKPI